MARVNKFLKVIKRAIPKSRKQQLILGGLLVMVIIGGLVVINNKSNDSNKPTSTKTKKAVDAARGAQPIANIPKGPQSSICKQLSAEQVSAAIGQNVPKAETGISDAKTDEGTVASCSYVVANQENQEVRSVVVMTRTLADPQAATKAYEQITKSNGRELDDIADRAFLSNNTHQLIVLKGGSVSSITISLVKSSDTEVRLRAVAQLL